MHLVMFGLLCYSTKRNKYEEKFKMKKKYLLAVGSKFLISSVVVAIITAFDLLVFK